METQREVVYAEGAPRREREDMKAVVISLRIGLELNSPIHATAVASRVI